MNKFYDTLTNTRGDSLPGYRAQVVNPNGTVVDIFADRSGTPFTDANGGTVNYATADSEGLVEFYWEAATGQIFQMLDPAGDLVKPIEGFADNYVIGNFSGDLPIERVVDLGDELLALNDGLLERPTTAALASTEPGEGAALVGLRKLSVDAVALTLEQLMEAGAFNAAQFGVSETASASVNTAALQKAVDFARVTKRPLILPPGEISLEGDVTVEPMPTGAGNWMFVMKGQGPAENGTYLHFSSGSLIVEDYHQLSDFRITSDADDGLIIRPSQGPSVRYPVRSSIHNIAARDCGGSGIVISDTWNYLMDNVYCRYNDGWGIEGRDGPNFSMSANVWTILGGEFQGNGTKQGTPVGPNGSTERGTGGGIYLGRKAIAVVIAGAAIEGNIGDGLKLGEGIRGLSIISCYFEKNGSHHTNVDICNDAPSVPALAATNVVIINTNHTPQAYNFAHSGIVQERAIELCGIASLRITNPVFMSSTDSGSASGFAKPPIRIWETQTRRATGWVESPHAAWTGYGDLLTNETDAFGYPAEHVFSPDAVVLPTAVDTDSRVFYAPLSRQAARGITVEWFTRRVSGGSNGQQARMAARIRRGPAGTLFSTQAYNIPFATVANAQKGQHFTTHVDLPSTLTAQGSAEVSIQRLGTHADDTLTADLNLLAVKITTYEGVVGAQ